MCGRERTMRMAFRTNESEPRAQPQRDNSVTVVHTPRPQANNETIDQKPKPLFDTNTHASRDPNSIHDNV